MRDVVVVGYLRTAQSRSRPRDPGRDWFFKIRADDMLSELLPELLDRVGVDAEELDDCLVGCAQGVSEQYTVGGRSALILSDFHHRTPAKFVDQQCGSAMAGVHIGFMEIAMGFADTVLCGGMEHMTRVAMGGNGAIEFNLRFFSDPALRHWDMFAGTSMGVTAENLAELGDISREDMDAWGARSHQRAYQAQQEGFFDGEILPLDVRQADGSVMTVDTDQAVRPDATVEEMAQLKTPFRRNGRVSVGTSSPLNAGATSLLLMSKELAEKKGIKPLATVRSIGFAGVEPNVMGKGVVPATRRALDSAGLAVEDIDVWEINEAFAAVALYAIKELGIDPEKANLKGGGIAIGHPLGATGIRLVGTLARILETENGRYGCAAMCCGGGQGVATIIERETA